VTQLGGFTGNVRDALQVFAAMVPSDPNVFWRTNLPRFAVEDGAAALVTARGTSSRIYLGAGDTVTSLSVIVGATASVTPTASWLALYDPAGLLLGQTADETTTVWAASTVKTRPLTAPVRINRTGLHYVVVMVAAATVPSLIGATCSRGVLASEVSPGELTNAAGLTGTAPATRPASAFQAFTPLVVAS
jgi:hypothetical protein